MWAQRSLEIAQTAVRDGIHPALQLHKLPLGSRYIGHDQFGNKYYEYEREGWSLGYGRLVIPRKLWNDDSSTVPPDWHAWLHYNSEKPPTEITTPQPTYKLAHQPASLSKYGWRGSYQPPGHFLTAETQEYFKPKVCSFCFGQ